MKSFLALIFLLLSGNLLAQDTVIHKGKFNLTGMLMNVNGQSQSVFNYDFNHNVKYKKYDVTFSSNWMLSYKDGTKTQDDNSVRLQPRFVANNWSLFTFGQVSRAFSRKLDNRVEAGFGGGHNIIKGKWYTITGSYAIMYDNSNYANGSEIKALRHSPRLQFFGDIKNVSFFTEGFFQPMTDNLDNYNYRTTVEIKYNVNKKLSLISSYKRWYETYNVMGTKGLIENFTIGTTFSY
jgi:hypothetical protein